jgi:uncharacterized membrane protein
MDAHHAHLLFNHFPIIGTFIGLIILITGMVMGSHPVRRVGYSVLVGAAVFTLPAFFSGEGAEEVVEKLPGMSHDLIHEHEEMAELALWMSEFMGLTALFGLFLDLRRHRYALALSIATLIMGIVCFASLIRTGNSGGEIRRPEIRTATETSASIEADND